MTIAPAATKPEVVALPDLEGTDAAAVLTELARALAELRPPLAAAALERALAEREALGSTALGAGVAAPHCRIQGLARACLAVARHRTGVPFGAADGAPSRLFLVLLTPAEERALHLRLLAVIARRVRDAQRLAAALAAPDVAGVLAALDFDAALEAV